MQDTQGSAYSRSEATTQEQELEELEFRNDEKIEASKGNVIVDDVRMDVDEKGNRRVIPPGQGV